MNQVKVEHVIVEDLWLALVVPFVAWLFNLYDVTLVGVSQFFMLLLFLDLVIKPLYGKIADYPGVLSDDIWDWLANSVEWAEDTFNNSLPHKDDEFALMLSLGLLYAGFTYSVWYAAILPVLLAIPTYVAAGFASHLTILLVNKLFGGVRGGGELQPLVYIGAFIALLATKFSWFAHLVG